MLKSKYARAIEKERPLAQHIPYSSHINDNTIMTKDGAVMRLFELSGMTFETKDDSEIKRLHDRLNLFFKGLSEYRCAVWTHIVRHRTQATIAGHYDNPYCQQFDARYNASFDDEVRINRLFVTVVLRPDQKLRRFQHVDAVRQHIDGLVEALDNIGQTVMNALSHYDIRPLGCFRGRSGTLCSEPLGFLNYLLTGRWVNVRVPDGKIDSAIGDAWLFMGAETIELRRGSDSTYIQGLDIKEYSNSTYAGMLNGLLYSNYDFVLTQSLSLFTKKGAHKHFVDRRQRMRNSGDEAVGQILAMDQAVNDLADGLFGVGEYHFSLMVMADSLDAVKLARSDAQKICHEQDLLVVPIAIATDAAFFAQLPANWSYRPRVTALTTRNFAGLSPFSNFMTGKRENNAWGPAVTRLNTLSGHPFYFNFHVADPNKSQFGDKPLGNTQIIGRSGTGKSVLLAQLCIQAQKFAENAPFSLVFFDKDRGAEVMIRALGGRYLRVEKGQPTGFNPFQMAATDKNLLFLKNLVALLVHDDTTPLTPMDKAAISKAVNTVMRMDKSMRRLSLVNQNISVGTSKEDIASSIKLRLAPWCHGGDFAWVFDNPTDELDFNAAANIGIDGTDFLDSAEVCTPISLYLLHRMDEIIDGRRFVYVMDEAWKWVDDPAFSGFVGDKQLTIRKQNGLGVFATQLPSSMLQSAVGAQLLNQTATTIFLPNPMASREEYIDQLKLSESEFKILMSFAEDSRMCLIKQGKNSAICSLAMPSSMKDDITLMSSGSDELPLLDEALALAGHDSNDWIPVFLDKVATYKATQKGASNAHRQ